MQVTCSRLLSHCQDWSLTTDTGQDPNEPLDTDGDLLENIPRHYPCFTHTLQLVVKDGLQQAGAISKVLAKVRRLVSHIRHSTHASELLEGEVRLAIDNATRWNSQLHMISQVRNVKEETWAKLDYPDKLI